MGRPPCCDKSNVKRGLWTAEEDAKILAYVATHGVGNWSLVPKKAGLNRCGKSCRLRWTNYLRPDLNHNSFTPQEEDLILKLHRAIGSRWSLIAKQLPGRTDNDVKNYWNTKLRKKLCKMGIDPLTHKPLSQILSDFGTIAASTAPRPSPSASSTVINPPPPPPPAVHLQIVNDRAQPICGSDPTLAPWNWSDFLTGEAFGGCDLDRVSSIGLQDEKLEVDFGKRGGYGGSDFGNETASSSSCCSSAGSSFVEAILNRDSEIKMELPEFFMEESFYC